VLLETSDPRFVELNIATEHSFQAAPLMMSNQSRHSARVVRTKRSAWAFACGARIGVWITWIPSLRKTSSKCLHRKGLETHEPESVPRPGLMEPEIRPSST
jgi:hypothetical protein